MVVSVVMEAYMNQFTTTELLSYTEVLYDEATEDWYAQRDLDEVGSDERNCMRLAHQFCLAMKTYRERFFVYVLSKPAGSMPAQLESYLLYLHYTIELCDDKEIDQLELDWITWQRNYILMKSGMIVEIVSYMEIVTYD